MNPLAFISAGVGVGKGIAGLVKKIKQRRAGPPEPVVQGGLQPRPTPTAPAAGPVMTGMNPIAPTQLELPSVQIARPGVVTNALPQRNSLEAAKQSYLFQAALQDKP